MISVELLSNKFQELLGSDYKILPMAQIQMEYTEAREVREGENYGYVNTYNDKFTALRQNKIIGILNLQNPVRANADFYYITTSYSIDFSVPTNNAIIGTGSEIIKRPDFDFFGDITDLIEEVMNKKLQISQDIYCKMSISEPTFKGKETDGNNEYAIFTVNGVAVISDSVNFGSDYKVELFVDNEYVELDGINSYNEILNNENTSITEQGTTKVKQNLAQSGWVLTLGIDYIETENKARKFIYEIIHKNKEIISPDGQTTALKRKIKTKTTSPYGDVREFNAIITIDFGTTRNGVGGYNISLTDDNKPILYDLSFDSQGGSQVESIKVQSYEPIGELPTPTKSGYVLIGWFIDDEQITNDTIYSYEGNKTAIAHWAFITYTLSFDSQGGSTIQSKQVNYGQAIGTLEEPTKVGYNFLGWLIDGQLISEETIWLYTDNKTAVANWEHITFTLSFDSDGGTFVESKELHYQDRIGTLAVPAKSGYLFDYWTIDGEQINENTTYDYLENKNAVANYTEVTSGLFRNGELIMSWEEIKETYPNAFATSGHIIGDLQNETSYLTSLNGDLVVDSEIVQVDGYAFANCESLTTIILPETVTRIGTHSFMACTSIEAVNLPESVTIIPDGAFIGCMGLTNVEIQSNITKIGINAFDSCLGLMNLTIPASVTDIGMNAFPRCLFINRANIYSTSSTSKANNEGEGYFEGCSSNLVIHASSTLNETSAKAVFGNYWNYNSATESYFTTIFDL